MMLKLWKYYQNCLAVHPVKTQIISSGFLWGAGDIAAQAVTHSTLRKHHQNPDGDEAFKINWKRVAITSMFGFGFVGPVGHFWYEGLDRFIRLRLKLQPKSAQFVATKVAVDGIIFGPLDLFAFFTYMGFSTGKSVDQVKEDVKRDFLPALVLEGGVWPLLQVANFRFVPVRLGEAV
ncbi:Mpv17/PMP22 [Macleaya cordata]|uniref:Mpv17/PMP22 n=1 Tax=Macleaya cordata TaxID=56857 RepID=A0A200RC97_MACCD|nr:Mpv17/PMP22 [Macleaya cordata]